MNQANDSGNGTIETRTVGTGTIGTGTIYEAIGGAETIRRLVEAFYPKVQAHPNLGPLFPEDITPVKEKQYMFLTQFFGGPRLYSDKYGPPMMRARHLPFPITPQRAEDWLGCMEAAAEEIGLPADLKAMVLERLRGPAYHFVNTGV
jgi:hemoglobin